MYKFFVNNEFAAYLLVIAAVIFAYAMSARVNSTFKKYNKVLSRNGIQANQVARQILDSYGLYHITITHVSGNLTDHFDSRNNVIALSDSTYYSTSVSAIGVAAHEVGHAVQYAQGYGPIKIRNAFAPVVSFGSQIWIFLFIIGMIMGIGILVDVGIAFFLLMILFQIITLPVEFNASKRALTIINQQFILEDDEIEGAKKTLNAAAMTYVASLMVSVAQLIRLLANSKRRN